MSGTCIRLSSTTTSSRRTHEHWLAAFKWLALLFVPLVFVAWKHPGVIWSWMDHGQVGGDILYTKKAGFLNFGAFTAFTAGFFGIWIWLSYRLRKHSFAQDVDGSADHTRSNRVTAAMDRHERPALRLAATASAFSEWLVSSPFAAEVTPDRLLGYLSGVPETCSADPRPKKLEWMIRQAKSIEGK